MNEQPYIPKIGDRVRHVAEPPVGEIIDGPSVQGLWTVRFSHLPKQNTMSLAFYPAGELVPDPEAASLNRESLPTAIKKEPIKAAEKVSEKARNGN